MLVVGRLLTIARPFFRGMYATQNYMYENTNMDCGHLFGLRIISGTVMNEKVASS